MQTQQLYEKDFYAWVYHNIELVRTKKWDEIDTDLLIEELESMAKRDRHELISHLIILIAHLLKWQFQFKQLSEMWQEFKGDSWQNSIIEQRNQLERQLQMSPSLNTYFDDAVQKAYSHAVNIAVKETNLPAKTFPKVCPYSIEQLLNENFYPQQE
ncbi:DUF29 domain-containing protein [Candidatus Albibeggiatoa sp. nov. BB20]|uniref:DUF29 domain-containing protein n=1 Tax=Candidatus Albibeggiatoa sp. nov. BB20 TaxID=3162723 RepID=UPI0033657E38